MNLSYIFILERKLNVICMNSSFLSMRLYLKPAKKHSFAKYYLRILSDSATANLSRNRMLNLYF